MVYNVLQYISFPRLEDNSNINQRNKKYCYYRKSSSSTQREAHLYLINNVMVPYIDFYLHTILKDSNRHFHCEEHYVARDPYCVEGKSGYQPFHILFSEETDLFHSRLRHLLGTRARFFSAL